MVVLSARKKERVEPVAQPAQAVVIVSWERVLQPDGAEPLELEPDLDRGAEAPLAVAFETWRQPGLVRVDQDREPITKRFANRFHRVDVVARVLRVEAQLHRLESLRQDPATVLHALLRRSDLSGCAVRGDAIRKLAPHLRNRESRGLARDVPH